MHTTDLTKRSKDHLEVLIKVASDYAYLIDSINNPKEIKQPTDWLRVNMLTYLVFIYSKLITSIRILHGYRIDDILPHIKSRSFDQFTCFDITRSVYESFLQSSWILKEFQTERQRHFLLLWWKLRAYSERVVIAKRRARKDENLDTEEQEIETFIKILTTKYTEELKIYVNRFGRLDKNPMIPNWPTPGRIYKIAGVSKFHHEYIYKFHSLYAHSEPFTMFQLGYIMKNPIDINSYIEFTAPYLIFFSASAIKNFSTLYPEVDICIKEDKQLQNLINKSTTYLQKQSGN